VHADRVQLRNDLAAVHTAKAGGNGTLKALLQPMRAQLRQQHAENVSAVRSARAAVKTLRQGFRQH
jgi:hypothetical protein